MNYHSGMSDEKLIQFYLSGDSNAMATLVELYKDRVYRSIYNMVQNKTAAEEIFQETFICLINEMIAGKTAEQESFLHWATRIAQRICLDHARQPDRACTNDDAQEAVGFASPLAVTSNHHYHESHGKIKSMIDMLPEKQREVIVLNHYGGMGFNEIAETLKCTLSMALDYMKLALNNLCSMMTEKEILLSKPYNLPANRNQSTGN